MDEIRSVFVTLLTILALYEQGVLSVIYNEGLTTASPYLLWGAIQRSLIKTLFCLLFPTLFPIRTSKNNVK